MRNTPERCYEGKPRPASTWVRLHRARAAIRSGVTDGDQGPCTRAGCARSQCHRRPRGRRSYATPLGVPTIARPDVVAGATEVGQLGQCVKPVVELGQVVVALPPPPAPLGVPADGFEILPCRPRRVTMWISTKHPEQSLATITRTAAYEGNSDTPALAGVQGRRHRRGRGPGDRESGQPAFRAG